VQQSEDRPASALPGACNRPAAACKRAVWLPLPATLLPAAAALLPAAALCLPPAPMKSIGFITRINNQFCL